MNDFNAALNERLAAIRKQGLYRELRRVDSPQSPRIEIGGKALLNFSSNDYLGLANEPVIKEAAIQAVEKFGAGAGASRLICGSLAPHHELEEALATFKGTEAALTFSTGYAAAIGTIGALLTKDDVIVIDKLVHACIVDAARLCGAKLRVFSHNDLSELEDILKWAVEIQGPRSKVQGQSRVLIVTESVFSMDGDQAALREIVELKNKYGAWLMVDEAHATGLYGKYRRGLAEELGVSGEIEVQMGTLGKALGASGGYICGSRPLIDFLVNRARSFIFSTAPVPAAAAAAAAGVRFVQSEAGEARRNLLWKRVEEFHAAFGKPPPAYRSAIIPIIIGDETEAVETAAALLKKNIFVPAIRYPTVARGEARLRVTVTAAHEVGEVNSVATAVQQLVNCKS
ncbi:MAG TPA: 8-amino-7-oxononanoate synthase [Verrucomicrobiae bacterium]|nr:8-amino-7-oxononanoate synthase [Verrucomicrobiae bacterium]